MRRAPVTQIDRDLCTGCGTCVKICPSDTLAMVDGKAAVTGDDSMQCAQCVAVCPVGAVSLPGIDTPEITKLPRSPELDALLKVMRNRRSVRKFTTNPLDRGILEDLVRTGVLAPSGTNSQKWTFTILSTRKAMEGFASGIAQFYEKINRMADNPVIRLFSPSIRNYRRRYYPQVKQSLKEWREDGKDSLFHGATAGIIIAMQKGASCGPEDALLAAENILLATHASKLGACLIGFAVEAMKRDATIQTALGIPADETVYAVIALGHPAVVYIRPAGRKPPLLRTV